jgi:MFS family permease
MLLIRFTERVAKGIRTAPRNSLIAASSGKNTTGRGFGFHKAMDNSGAILGPLTAFAILSIFPADYRRLFIFAAIPGFLRLTSVILFVKGAKEDTVQGWVKYHLKTFQKNTTFLLV